MTASDVIRSAVSEAVAGTVGQIHSWSGPRRGKWSWSFLAETAGQSPARLLVKIPRWEEASTLDVALKLGAQEDTAEEFAALVAIHAAVSSAGDPGLAAAEPVAHIAAVNALVMERVDGRTLKSRLGWSRGGRDAGRLFARLGRWLRLFHDVGEAGSEPFSVEDEMVRWTVPGDRSFPEAVLDRGIEAARQLSDSTFPVRTLHGDLSLENILITPDERVAVVDPNRRRGRPSRDIARLGAELRLGRSQWVTRGVLRSDDAIEGWLVELIGGYGDVDRRILSFDLAAEALSRWVDLSVGGLAGGVAAGWARRIFAREVRGRLEAV